MENMIQCQDCQGWLSPKAIFCPSCGARGPGPGLEELLKRREGFPFVRTFWAVALIAVVVVVVLD